MHPLATNQIILIGKLKTIIRSQKNKLKPRIYNRDVPFGLLPVYPPF
jgi:hypothetical protein